MESRLVAILDSSPGAGETLERAVAEAGAVPRRLGSPTELGQLAEREPVALAIVDGSTPQGRAFARELLERGEIPVLVGADARDTAAALDLVRAGARDFVPRPYESEEVAFVVRRALDLSQAAEDAAPAPATAQTQILGSAQATQALRESIARAANGVATVLVRGESGTGKELVARQLHELSPRRKGPMVTVHCAALPETLLESELFGYEKGAFTGAAHKKPGRVQLAEGGTLFLDEIGDVPLVVQVKLLRLLQQKEYEPVGATSPVTADVRFVAATHRNLEEMVKDGKFREDLFYRLNVVPIEVPPLRARSADIPELAVHFARATARQNGRPPAAPDAAALDLLAAHPWPGNVRQLQNIVERLVVLSQTPRISAEDVRRELGRREGVLGFALASGLDEPVPSNSTAIELAAALKKAERRAILRALERARGNRSQAARLLGVSRRTLYTKLDEHGLA